MTNSKKVLKIWKNLTNSQNTKTQQQNNLSTFYKSYNEINAIFQGIHVIIFN